MMKTLITQIMQKQNKDYIDKMAELEAQIKDISTNMKQQVYDFDKKLSTYDGFVAGNMRNMVTLNDQV